MESSEDQPVGMADIAAAASVAISTVSRALSGAPGVSAAKRKEIVEIARRLGYLSGEGSPRRLSHEQRPGYAVGARHLVQTLPYQVEENAAAATTSATATLTSATPTSTARTTPGARPAFPAPQLPETKELRITAVVPESDRWIFGSILAGIHDVLTPEDVSLQVKQGLSASERARFLSNPHLANQTDLVILVPAPRDIGVEELTHLPVPAVIAGTVVPGIPSVGIDDVAVGQKATNYLRNLGLTSIAYVGFLDHEGTSGVATHRRGLGYEEAMTKAGLSVWHVKVPFTPSPGRAAAEALLAGENLPQGVICSSDEIAADMMNVFRQAGVSIPDDISIIGVDDHPIAGFLGLTSIGQPAREQGREAAKLALRILESGNPVSGDDEQAVADRDTTLAVGGAAAVSAVDDEAASQTITLPTRLIIRETTRRASR
ncbi:MAG: LacI family DNA-binding transcriptional regulator [Ancrocorticia sp.]